MQGKRIASGKQVSLWMVLVHVVIVGLIAFLALLPFISLQWLYGLAAILVTHLVFDALKLKLQAEFNGYEFELAVLDQCLHLLIIFVVWAIWGTYELSNIWKLLTDLMKRSQMLTELTIGVTQVNEILLYAVGYIFIIKGGTGIVRSVLDKFVVKVDKIREGSSDELRVGEVIGYLERTLILTLVVLNQYVAIPFVIIAKSIARFKELQTRAFAEYYLVGTLTSVTIALIIGIILNIVV